MNFIKLTKEQGIAAGKAVMTDVRCTEETKKEIRRGLAPFEGGFSYTCTGAVGGKQNQWYDEIMVSFGNAGSI